MTVSSSDRCHPTGCPAPLEPSCYMDIAETVRPVAARLLSRPARHEYVDYVVDDVVMAVLTREKAGGFTDNAHAFALWITPQRAKNILNTLRRQGLVPPSSGSITGVIVEVRPVDVIERMPDTGYTIEDQVEISMLADYALSRVDDPDDRAVVLYRTQGMPWAEIGTRLHLAPDAARMRYNRAIKRLRQLLRSEGL